VYTKEGDTIDAIGPFKFYRSFEDQMNSLKDAGTITDWKSVAYDWRLSLEDLVDKGMQHGERIDYGEATDTPYIEQTLRALAATSKTGKVTIIAHSNGGLVAKKLMQKLGNADTAALIDTVIFVGVPQSGTPQALAGALHGYGSALPADWCAAWEVFGSLCASNASRATSRMLAENMPMAYDLLPSFTYFNDVKDALHPIVAFAADHLFAKERNNYGFIIQNENEQTEFATDQDGGRSKPAPADLTTPNILNANLLGSANEMHAELDTWVPPPQVQVYQVAGWGADTLSGIEYYEAAKASAPGGYVPRYRPEFVEDGDNTVTIPSALMMPIAENVKRYWINLTSKIALQPLGGAVHSNLLEMRGLRELIQNILTGTLQDLLPDGITTTPPANISTRKKLLFTLHGSVHATLKNDVGQTTILNPDGTIVQGIPDVEAGQFGDTGYMLMPVGAVYHLLLDNNDSGTVDLDVQHLIDDTITDTSTFEDIPVGPATPSEVDVSTDGSAASVEVTPLSNVLSTETSSPVPSSGSSSVSSTKTSFVIRTKGVHDSKSVLTPPKPIKVPVVKKVATTTKKIATPKTKPLTAKAKKTISALLNALTAELQGLLTKLPH
jgi:pimeloyl-ACP methyl ester carboxylesterase